MHKYLSLILSTALTLFATTALADNSFSLHLEPGVVVPLTAPQSNLYNPGMVLGAKGMFALTPNFSIGPSVSSLYLSRQVDNGQNAGTLWQFGGSARLQTDRRNTNDSALFRNFSPWVDADVTMAVTGNLIRPAFDFGLGAETPLDQNHIFWLGPFVRYTHMFQSSDSQDGVMLDKHDVNFLQVGVSFSFDAPTTPRHVTQTVVVTKQVNVPVKVPCKAAALHKINLSEKIYFDWDSSNLRWESKDKLDVVASQIIESNQVTKVQGNASSDGQLAHNVKLAMARTEAVVSYLVSHGVNRSLLRFESFGVAHPAAPNTTKEGRERNRRVEFVVNFTSVVEGK